MKTLVWAPQLVLRINRSRVGPENLHLSHIPRGHAETQGIQGCPLYLRATTLHMGTANRGIRWASVSLPGLQAWPASGSPEGYLPPAAPARVEGSRPFLLHWGLRGLSCRCQGHGIKGNLCMPASPDLA